MDACILHRSQEEEEALAEIKRALNIQEDAEPPPITISVPISRRKSSTNAMASSRVDKDNIPLISIEPDSMDRTSVTESYDDNDLTRLSTTSMEGTFSEGAVDSNASTPRFYIGGIGVIEEHGDEDGEEGESSVRSRVSLVDAEEMSYDELLALVERLYDHLKQADEALTKEQARRSAREKSLIKLAKELKNRKATITECVEQIKEVSCRTGLCFSRLLRIARTSHENNFPLFQFSSIVQLEDELQVARSERELLEQRLDAYMEYSKKRKDGWREALNLASEAVEEKYKTACLGHELKIQEINRLHAEQCDQLCREVINANREAVCLRKRIAEMSSIVGVHGGVRTDRDLYLSTSLDRVSCLFANSISFHRNARKPARQRNGMILLATILVLIFSFGQSGHLAMNNRMHFPVVWKENEEYSFNLVKPLVSLPFLLPKSPSEDCRSALSKGKPSAKIIVGPGLEAAAPGVKDDPTLHNRRSASSYPGKSRIEMEAEVFLSPISRLRSRLKRLILFFKKIIRKLIGNGGKL